MRATLKSEPFFDQSSRNQDDLKTPGHNWSTMMLGAQCASTAPVFPKLFAFQLEHLPLFAFLI
jgi:hypothetical protein